MDTITSGDEISQLFAAGRWVKTPYVTLILGEREPSPDSRACNAQHGLQGRVAFIAGKKLGCAVWRNRAKRRMRALCRELGGPWEGMDVVFMAKSALTQATYSKVLSTCDKALRRALQRTETG